MPFATPRSTPESRRATESTTGNFLDSTTGTTLESSTGSTATTGSTAAPRRLGHRARRHPKLFAATGLAACALVAGGVFTGTSGLTAFGAGAASASETAPVATVTPASDGRVSVHAGSAVSRSTADAIAESTLTTGRQVAQAASGKVGAKPLTTSMTTLAGYRTLTPDVILTRAAVTQTAAQQIGEATLAVDQRIAAEKAAARARAVAAAKAAAEAAAEAKAAAAAQAAAQAKAAAAAAQATAAGNTVAGAQATAASLASSKYGWGSDQFSCLVSLWNKESGWNYRAYNSSGATGIPQALPGSKMASAGTDWATNATTQIVWGLGYIAGSYGTPCAAWAHSEANNWY